MGEFLYVALLINKIMLKKFKHITIIGIQSKLSTICIQ